MQRCTVCHEDAGLGHILFAAMTHACSWGRRPLCCHVLISNTFEHMRVPKEAAVHTLPPPELNLLASMSLQSSRASPVSTAESRGKELAFSFPGYSCNSPATCFETKLYHLSKASRLRSTQGQGHPLITESGTREPATLQNTQQHCRFESQFDLMYPETLDLVAQE